MDNVDIGFMACRELVPDVWDLADYVGDSMAEVLAAVDSLTDGDSGGPVAKKKAAKTTTPAKKTATAKKTAASGTTPPTRKTAAAAQT